MSLLCPQIHLYKKGNTNIPFVTAFYFLIFSFYLHYFYYPVWCTEKKVNTGKINIQTKIMARKNAMIFPAKWRVHVTCNPLGYGHCRISDKYTGYSWMETDWTTTKVLYYNMVYHGTQLTAPYIMLHCTNYTW